MHEFVQSPRLLHELVTRTEIQVVGVAQDDLRLDVVEIARGHRLDRRLRADGHVRGRFNHAVRRKEPAAARAGVLVHV